MQVKPLILIETDLMFLKRETRIYMYGNYIAITKLITNMTKKRKRDWLAKWLVLGFTDYRRREFLGFRHRVLYAYVFAYMLIAGNMIKPCFLRYCHVLSGSLFLLSTTLISFSIGVVFMLSIWTISSVLWCMLPLWKVLLWPAWLVSMKSPRAMTYELSPQKPNLPEW